MSSLSNLSMANRRFLVLLIAAAGLLSLISLLFSRRQSTGAALANTPIHHVSVDDTVLKGDAVMGKIGNETLK